MAAQLQNNNDTVKNTKLAQFFLPGVTPGSALFPTDQWILSNAAQSFKSNKALQKSLVKTAALGLLTTGLVVAGITAAVLTFPAFPLMAAGVLASVTTGALAGIKTRDSFLELKTKTLPSLFVDMGTRYLKMKGDEMMKAWKQRAEEKRAEKLKTATPEKALEKEIVAPIEAVPSVTTSLGSWALKKAFQKSQKPQDTNDAKPPVKETPVQKSKGKHRG